MSVTIPTSEDRSADVSAGQPADDTAGQPADDTAGHRVEEATGMSPLVEADLLVEEVSIDGMCGVY